MEIMSFRPGPSWIRIILALLVVVAVVSGGLQAFLKGYRKKLPREDTSFSPILESSGDWDALCSRADIVVQNTLNELPDPVALEARKVPYLFKPRAEKESGGYRTLGSYHNFTPGQKSLYEGPIVLYLKTIEEICAEKNEDFVAKLRTTYLHELGHHFGWDEVDLARHGLPSGRPPGK
jgi:predicted Zn-dependent protease with MMP-like domain